MCIGRPKEKHDQILIRKTMNGGVADPGSGAFLTPGSGMGKNQDPNPGIFLTLDLGWKNSDPG
jgi:hypothetical protein